MSTPTEIRRSGMPVVTLTSGLKVGNLGSPHAFTFEDGSVLPAVAQDRVKGTMLTASEQTFISVVERDGKQLEVENIALEFLMNAGTADTLIAAWRMWKAGKVDIVLVPLPCLLAMKKCVQPVEDGIRFKAVKNPFPFNPEDWSDHPFRAIRVANRTTKVLHTNRFCV